MSIQKLLLSGVLAALCVHGQIPSQDLPALAQAVAYFRDNAASYGLTDSRQALRARRSSRDPKGLVHIRFDQYFDGVKVFEGEAIAHVDGTGRVAVTDAIRREILATSKPGLSSKAAGILALLELKNPAQSKINKAELEIVPRGRIAKDALVWHFQIFSRNKDVGAAQTDVFVDANSGERLWKFDSLHTVTKIAIGQSMFSGAVPITVDDRDGTYYLIDSTRGDSETQDMGSKRRGTATVASSTQVVIGDGSVENTDPDTAAVDAHYALALTWDYFLTMFGRNGIDGEGTATLNLVHYGRSYENAYWSDDCFCMTYGDGGDSFYPLVSLDVGGHEMAHGVMSTEANLTYDGESGGLNEANSDIFGTMVEFYANNAVATPNYWIGERITKSNYASGSYVQEAALRYMDDPQKDGASPACWSDRLRLVNVHYSSGPANHMFYLLSSTGPITGKCNTTQVPGIGRDKAARIWYEAMTNYMTKSTDYAGARTACLEAATTLYGNASAEYNAVAAAFEAINVR